MERLKHVRPSMEYKEDAIRYIQEHYECGSQIHGVGGLDKCLNDYEGWLRKVEEERNMEPSDTWVPAETYFLVRESDNKIVGMISIRLTLNKSLEEFGGHIGYGIRPSERQKGYNKVNLYLALKRCNELGIEKVYLDCDIDNPGSYRTMEALGGVREKKYTSSRHEGEIYRYGILVRESINKYRSIYEPKIVGGVLMGKIDLLDLSRDSLKYLRSKGIVYIEDIVKLSLDELEENLYYREIKCIRDYLHEEGLTLKDEYKGINLSKEQLEIPISNIDEIDKHIKKILIRSLGIRTLGDLVTTHYDTILRTRNVGVHKMGLIKKYLHSIGCNIRGESDNYLEIVNKLKEQGIRLLEEDIKDPKLYLILYKNGIYTLEDLVNYGPKVLELPNYGPLRRKELIRILKELGIDLEPVVVVNNGVQITKSTEELIEEVRLENSEIRERIESKQAMLLEYDELLRERAELQKREEELNQLIKSKLKELGGKSYVKRQGNS